MRTAVAVEAGAAMFERGEGGEKLSASSISPPRAAYVWQHAAVARVVGMA